MNYLVISYFSLQSNCFSRKTCKRQGLGRKRNHRGVVLRAPGQTQRSNSHPLAVKTQDSRIGGNYQGSAPYADRGDRACAGAFACGRAQGQGHVYSGLRWASGVWVDRDHRTLSSRAGLALRASSGCSGTIPPP